MLPDHPNLPVCSGHTRIVRVCIRRARATKSGRLFSAFQGRLAREIRDCEAISAQEAAAFTAHQAKEACKKGWCEKKHLHKQVQLHLQHE